MFYASMEMQTPRICNMLTDPDMPVYRPTLRIVRDEVSRRDIVFPVAGVYRRTTWTQDQWDSLDERERPAGAFPGCGMWCYYEWVGPTPAS